MITSRRTVTVAGIIVATAIVAPPTASVAQTLPTFGIDSSKLWPMFQTQLSLSPQGQSQGQTATNPDTPVGTVVPTVGGKGGPHAGSGEDDSEGGPTSAAGYQLESP